MASTPYFSIKDWAQEDKPREKLFNKGKKELTNAELIGILLRSGNPGQSAVELAKEVLDGCHNSLSELSRISAIELMNRHKGMGEAKVGSILAALELGYRLLNERRADDSIIISDSRKLFEYISDKLIDLPHEEFWAVFLNVKNKVIGCKQIGLGGITEAPVDYRLIFKYALERDAVHVAVAHNHPSGDIQPSILDNKLTRTICEAGKLMNIRLLEHIIVGIGADGAPTYYSYHDAGNIIS